MVSGSLIINKYILKPKSNRFLYYEPLEKELLWTEINLSKEVANGLKDLLFARQHVLKSMYLAHGLYFKKERDNKSSQKVILHTDSHCFHLNRGFSK